MISPKKSQRQEAKEKSRALKDLYFLVQWEEKDQDDGESLYDVLPSKAIVADDPLAVEEGQTVSVSFKKKTYPALIVGRGSYHAMQELLDRTESGGKMDTETPSLEKTQKPEAENDTSLTTAIRNSSKKVATKRPRASGNPKVSTSPSTRKKSPSKPKSKAPKRNLSAENARSKESDRISSLILTSTDDFNDYAGLLPIDDTGGGLSSTPQHSPRSGSMPRDGASESHSILPDNKLGDGDPPHGSVSSESSSFPFSHFHSSRETPKRWIDNNFLNDRSNFSPEYPNLSYDSMSSSSPNPSPVFSHSSVYPPVYPSSSQSPFFQPLPPYSMPHSQSWPPSNQNISAQMAEMKQLLMTSLSAMQSEIQTLKTDKAKKRKRSREQSVVSASQSDSELSEVRAPVPPAATPGVLLGDPHGQNLFVAHPTIKQSDVRATEALSKNPSKFVLSMMDLFFSRSTLANSLATRKEGRDRLDADIMEGLRLHINYKYPCHGEDQADRWHKIVKSVNDKCRNTKNRNKE